MHTSITATRTHLLLTVLSRSSGLCCADMYLLEFVIICSTIAQPVLLFSICAWCLLSTSSHDCSPVVRLFNSPLKDPWFVPRFMVTFFPSLRSSAPISSPGPELHYVSHLAWSSAAKSLLSTASALQKVGTFLAHCIMPCVSESTCSASA